MSKFGVLPTGLVIKDKKDLNKTVVITKDQREININSYVKAVKSELEQIDYDRRRDTIDKLRNTIIRYGTNRINRIIKLVWKLSGNRWMAVDIDGYKGVSVTPYGAILVDIDIKELDRINEIIDIIKEVNVIRIYGALSKQKVTIPRIDKLVEKLDKIRIQIGRTSNTRKVLKELNLNKVIESDNIEEIDIELNYSVNRIVANTENKKWKGVSIKASDYMEIEEIDLSNREVVFNLYSRFMQAWKVILNNCKMSSTTLVEYLGESRSKEYEINNISVKDEEFELSKGSNTHTLRIDRKSYDRIRNILEELGYIEITEDELKKVEEREKKLGIEKPNINIVAIKEQ